MGRARRRRRAGSSMMPQKKNPQVAEHVRGRAGIAIGRLTGFSRRQGTAARVQPRPAGGQGAVFAQVDALAGALDVLALAYGGLRFDAARMAAAADDGLSVATDVAEALVREGVPFREAHERVAEPHRRRRALRRADGRRGLAARSRPGMPGRWRRAAGGAAAARSTRIRVREGGDGALPAQRRRRRAAGCSLGGVDAEALGHRFGTPLYVYDAATVALPARAAYQEPLAAAGGRAVFALKALSTPGVLRLIRDEGLGADVAVGGRGRGGAARRVPGAGPRRPRQRQERRRPRRRARRRRRTGRARRAGGGRRAGGPRAPRRRRARTCCVRVNPDIARRHAPQDPDRPRRLEVRARARRRAGPRARPARRASACARPARPPRLAGASTRRPLRSSRGVVRALLHPTARLEPELLDLGGGLGVAYAPGEPAPGPATPTSSAVSAVAAPRSAAGAAPAAGAGPARSSRPPASPSTACWT